MNTLETIYAELTASRKVLDDFIKDEMNMQSIQSAADVMINCLKNGGKIIACGNGGSMCDAMHFASELTGRYRDDRKPLAAVAISDPAHMSCVGNDYGYKEVFGRYIEAHAQKGDILLALSTSGNSENIIIAAHEMHTKQCGVVYITGNDKRSLAHRTALVGGGDCLIEIPHHGTADRVQETSIIILHILVHLIEKGLGYDDYMTDILHTICIQCDLPASERTMYWVYEAVHNASADPEATYNLKHNKDLDSMVKFNVFMLEVEKDVACKKALYLRIGDYHSVRSYYENKIKQQQFKVL